ncbi:MAG: DUF6440 family protein [Anaerorhabdus sp.]|uniref:DUF6440 family protein n=1 Tax=Anaerorhabdus sp. TaxID=1872524 RepID=UPI002FCBC49D
MSNNRFKEVYREGRLYPTVILEDTVTGIQYLWVTGSTGAGLTPLLDSEGKPVVNKK